MKRRSMPIGRIPVTRRELSQTSTREAAAEPPKPALMHAGASRTIETVDVGCPRSRRFGGRIRKGPVMTEIVVTMVEGEVDPARVPDLLEPFPRSRWTSFPSSYWA